MANGYDFASQQSSAQRERLLGDAAFVGCLLDMLAAGANAREWSNVKAAQVLLAIATSNAAEQGISIDDIRYLVDLAYVKRRSQGGIDHV